MSYSVGCPSNTYLCYKDINTLYKNTKDSKDAIDNNNCILDNDCDSLFNNLVDGKMTCKELYKLLLNSPPSKLKEQIKYNLFRLVEMKAKMKPATIYSTYEWWKQNIFKNKIQQFIYLISLLISLLIVGYFIKNLFTESEKIFKGNKKYVFLGISFIIAITLIILYITFGLQDNKYQSPNVNNNISEKDKNKYSDDIKKNWKEGTKASLNTPPSIALILLVLISLLLTLGYLEKLPVADSWLIIIPLGIIMGIIISINVIYCLFIPQLIIIYIIFQKILLTGNFVNVSLILIKGKPVNVSLILKGILLFAILVFNIVMIYGEFKNKNVNTFDNNNCTILINPNIIGQYIMLFIGLITMFLYTFYFNRIENILSDDDIKDLGNWGLYLKPFFNIIISLCKKTNT